MGAPLCVGAPQRWVRRVVGVGLVSVSTVCLAAVCRVSSSAAPHGGLLWWCLGGWSWALRFLGGCGTCGVGLAGGGGGRVGGLACLPSAPPVAPSSACPLLLSFRWLVWLCFFFFFLGGLARVLCVGVGVCRCRLPVPRAPVRGGADGGWLAAVVVWRLRGWLRLLVSVWVAWPGVGGRVGVFVAWADGVVGSVGVVGLCGCRVCVRRRRSGLGWGTVGDAMGGGDAGDAYGGVL